MTDKFRDLDRQEEQEEAKGKLGKCVSCGQPLGIPGGMGNTGLCGPCCTGEADTASEFAETW